jgi:hypothetical protein
MDNPKIGDLIKVINHNCKDCLGTHQVSMIEEDGYAYYEVKEIGLCGTFRERYVLVSE